MSDVIRVVRLDKFCEDGRWRILATRSNGSKFYCGDVKTERGAKMMLKRRAKQFKLTAYENDAS